MWNIHYFQNSQPGLEENNLIYEKPTGKIIPNGEQVNAFIQDRD
jgi:hypothetical protein